MASIGFSKERGEGEAIRTVVLELAADRGLDQVDLGSKTYRALHQITNTGDIAHLQPAPSALSCATSLSEVSSHSATPGGELVVFGQDGSSPDGWRNQMTTTQSALVPAVVAPPGS